VRAGASLGLRIAAAAAFGATAAVAVILSRGAPLHAALTSAKAQGVPRAAVTAVPSAAVPLCPVSGLRISLGAGAHVTSVVISYPLDFTNVSSVPCALAGYPEVAAYQGARPGGRDPAPRGTSVAALRVLLAPGQTA